MTTKLAVVTDIHYGHTFRSTLGGKADRLLKHFIKAANRYHPAAVVNIGDNITAHNHDDSEKFMRHITSYFNQLAVPAYHVLGNWDVKYLDRAECAILTGSPATSYSRDVGDYHLLFLNPSHTDKHEKDRLLLQDSDIEWVRQDLAGTTKPTVVFSHVPLDDVSERIMREIPAGEQHKIIANRFGFAEKGPALRAAMEQSGKVVLCMSGHVHKNICREINGIHYITQQSLSHLYQDRFKIASRTFSFIELAADKIKVRLKGKAPKTFTLIPRPMI